MPKPSVREAEREERVPAQEHDEEQRDVAEEVAVEVLEDEREARLAGVPLGRTSRTAQAGGDQKNER